ncbi:MAG: hypothetical protein IKE00_00745 [Oscillospiraceae bacterium]|nr:hypothetical protein [Oscillospiraceae bacterium]
MTEIEKNDETEKVENGHAAINDHGKGIREMENMIAKKEFRKTLTSS